jgi:hypothetical protein
VCNCDGSPPDRRDELPGEAKQAAELAAPLLGEQIVVRDEALGTSWRAVEPGTTGLHGARTTMFDEHATVPFRWFFGLDAERMDTGEPRQIEIAVTFMPSEQGPKPIAAELTAVGGGTKRDDRKEPRTFFACPEGNEIHFAQFGPGTSPCHHVPLVPILHCGCDDGREHVAASDCAFEDRTAVKKSACARNEGAPIPK